MSMFAEQTAVTRWLSIEEKIKKQERALRKTPYIPLDKANILESMPLLLNHQSENVYKAEKRFLTPAEEQLDGLNKGIMFTDNTGSGKTFTGLGIITRFVLRGKKDGLIVVPTDAKAKDWIVDGRYFGLGIYQLKNSKEAGRDGSIVITTYANIRQNDALVQRSRKKPFDFVVYDESHKILMNEHGRDTNVDAIHKKITYSPTQAFLAARENLQHLLKSDLKEYNKILDKTWDIVRAEGKRLEELTKVVFLSATPFSYPKNLKYADGFLFRIREGILDSKVATERFNEFYIKNFGYRMLNNKLTEPEAAVDTGLMERRFHSRLVREGVVSSTRLRLDRDYSREFVLVDDKLGFMIDEGYKVASDTNTYKYLPNLISERFGGVYSSVLLESIKARHVINRIKQHLALGRKVVVFHSYVNSVPSHPFDFRWVKDWIVKREIDVFYMKYSRYRDLDLSDLKTPVDTLAEAFGDKVLFFNGNVPAKKRVEAKSLFNNDDSGKDIIVVQMEAGKEGISLHDTTGNKPRVIINLALPVRPTDAIQTEGRIYRVGQYSNAIIEYLVLHLQFEKFAFAYKINERVKTAENLAFGEQARNLKDAFKEGYKNPTIEDPHTGQGTGSRDADMVFENIDEFKMALSFYYSTAKNKNSRRSREGTDYYATAEPIGYSMVKWLFIEAGDRLLEPSAGHGAIGRFFPDNTVNKLIEPSTTLRADLAINCLGDVLAENFEDHHLTNKYDGIAMNPPFGHDGKTAWDHFEKALSHLKDRGRCICILPDSSKMNERLREFFGGKKGSLFYVAGAITLPGIAFQRAGTMFRTKIVIIDKYVEQGNPLPSRLVLDLSDIEDINELFKAVNEIEAPKRLR